jgi:hypothetical protein
LKKKNFEQFFIHKRCCLEYTKNAGYDSMCITCDGRGKKAWQREMRMKGIYIPEEMASWEKGGNYSDQVKNKCQDPDCEIQGKDQDVFTCFVCGCFPRHLECVGAEKHSDYHCDKCIDQSFVKLIPIFPD